MASPNYFTLTPRGVGSHQIEALASYVYRLARAHGVTRYQLVTHIQQWWLRTSGRKLPRCESVRLNGYSKDALIAIEALTAATGERRLGRCTIASLSGICAANCIGSVRHARAWCPACFREDIADGLETYDRLIWQLQPVERCSLHKLALVDRCPQCGEVQHHNKRSSPHLHICWRCEADLSSQDDLALYRSRPYFGEAQLLTLLEYTASTSRPGFQEDACRRFLEALDRVSDHKRIDSALDEIFHCPRARTPERPRLQALLAFSIYFSVDLPSLLKSPRSAVRQLSMPFPASMPAVQPRLRSEQVQREWFAAKLKEAIEGDGPYLSPPKFCALHQRSYSSALHQNSRWMKRLGDLWRHQKSERKEAVKDRVTVAVRKQIELSPFCSAKRLSREVALTANAPLRLARAEIKRVR